jgi:tetratricopeptide (TPR) repeat protein
MLQRHYGEAMRVLKTALAGSPGDNRLRVELGRAYIYHGEDRRAIHLFADVLRQDAANRPAKLGLAQAFGNRGSFEESNRLYRELLAANPDDEAAAIGLVNNLMHQKQTVEAGNVVGRALAYHPHSLRLQEYKDRLEQGNLGPDERVPQRRPDSVFGYGDYVADSEGNRFWQLSQRFDSEITRVFHNRAEFEERRLWKTGQTESPVTVASGTDEMRLRLTNWLWMNAGGGIVRFPDGTNFGLYSGGLAVVPARRLLLEGSFSRFPLYPTAQAADLNLLVEGWQAQAGWQPGRWNFGARWSQAHISDGNHIVRENFEVLRWLGSSRFSFGAGYRYTHYEFSEHLLNGYFNPKSYQSQLGEAGFNFRVGRVFHAEYMLRVGAEEISPNGYQAAWEINLHNRFPLGNWEFIADYFYFRLAQITGAYRADGGRLGIAYRF